MTREQFEKMIQEIGLSSVPERFREKMKNVIFIVEDEPEETVRRDEGLQGGETLLGLYRGIPHTERGEGYGIGITLPDTITLYQKSIEEAGDYELEKIRQVICDTIWHEVAHHFGFDEEAIEQRLKIKDKK